MSKPLSEIAAHQTRVYILAGKHKDKLGHIQGTIENRVSHGIGKAFVFLDGGAMCSLPLSAFRRATLLDIEIWKVTP